MANAKFESDEARAGAVNRVGEQDARAKANASAISRCTRAAHGGAEGDARERHRRLREPGADTPPYKLGMAAEPEVDDASRNRLLPDVHRDVGAPEMEVPAGFTTWPTSRTTC